MDHIDCLNVINFSKCKLNKTLTILSNQDLFQLLATIYQESYMFETSMPSVSQETSYLAAHRQAKINQLMTRGLATNGRGVSRSNSPAEFNTNYSFKGKHRNQILLAIAIVEVENKSGQYVPCRELIDNASQSHNITERCVQRLRFSRTQTNAELQGISSVNTETYHSVSIHLRSRHTDWHTTINCAILSHITVTTPSTKLETSTWKIPKDFKLADELFDQPGSINLFIGGDLFYEKLRSDRRTRPGNYPVLQETILGCTLAGRIPATITQHDPHPTFLLREDNRLELNLNCLREVETVEPSTITTEQQVFKQHFVTHTTEQLEGGSDIRLPTKIDLKLLGTSRLPCRAKTTYN